LAGLVFLTYHLFLLFWAAVLRVGAKRLSNNLSAVLVLSFCCDTIFIIGTRVILRKTTEMSSVPKVVLALASSLILAIVLISPLLMADFLGNYFGGAATEVIYLVGASNIFDVCLAILFGILVILLLIHYACWPILVRTLFKMQDIGTKGRRAILTAVGISLLSASIFHEKIPDLLKEVIKAFGG